LTSINDFIGWDQTGAGAFIDDAPADFAKFVFGGVVVIRGTTPSSATFRTKLNKWAKKWGSVT
jgi:hypothetical protein